MSDIQRLALIITGAADLGLYNHLGGSWLLFVGVLALAAGLAPWKPEASS